LKEKEVWTLDGRKKIFLVDDDNHVIKEIDDLGPLSETEKLWVMLQPGIPFKEWLKDYEKEQKENQKSARRKSKVKNHFLIF
jgi:hypothetical protein